jgi:hypothetical protein
MSEETRSPEEVAKDVEAKERVREARERFLGEVRVAINAAPTDPNVRILLRYVMELSGYELNPVALGANGEVMVSSTVYNSGRESLYHDLRRSMSAETKNAVERS